MRVLEDIFIAERVIAFERYNFVCREQKKNESLEQFQADLVELSSRADCRDHEGDKFGTSPPHTCITNRSQRNCYQDAFEYAIRCKKRYG